MLSMTLMPAQRKRIGRINVVISMLEETRSEPASTFG
jgi:hypothetical protein